MSSQKPDASSDDVQMLISCVIGGAVCCYFVPSYIPIAICCGGLLLCTHGIMSVLRKYENIDDMNFVEKEKVEYFKKK